MHNSLYILLFSNILEAWGVELHLPSVELTYLLFCLLYRQLFYTRTVCMWRLPDFYEIRRNNSVTPQLHSETGFPNYYQSLLILIIQSLFLSNVWNLASRNHSSTATPNFQNSLNSLFSIRKQNLPCIKELHIDLMIFESNKCKSFVYFLNVKQMKITKKGYKSRN